MNRFRCVLLVFLFVSTCNLFGDIIPTRYTYPPAEVLITIENLDEYPDIVVVGVSNCPSISGSKKAYIIEPGVSLKVHKSCPLTIYAVKKDYLEKKKLGKIKWNKDENVIISNLTVTRTTIDPDRAVNAIRMHFRIAGFNDEEMVLYNSSLIYKYTGGLPDVVENLEYKGDLSKLRKTF